MGILILSFNIFLYIFCFADFLKGFDTSYVQSHLFLMENLPGGNRVRGGSEGALGKVTRL